MYKDENRLRNIDNLCKWNKPSQRNDISCFVTFTALTDVCFDLKRIVDFSSVFLFRYYRNCIPIDEKTFDFIVKLSDNLHLDVDFMGTARSCSYILRTKTPGVNSGMTHKYILNKSVYSLDGEAPHLAATSSPLSMN